MCGIVFILNSSGHDIDEKFYNLKHRGPDSSKMLFVRNSFLGFHRLSINDTSDQGMQPFKDEHGNYLICNGEIFNYESFEIKTKSGSDCEVLLPLMESMRYYEDFGVMGDEDPEEFLNALDGDFAIVMLRNDGQVFAARDPIGVRPLYYGFDKINKSICFSSEMKSLLNICKDIKHFPPGYYYTSKSGFKTYEPINYKIKNGCYDKNTLRQLFTSSIEKRLLSDRPIGYFLSGGLDSSLVCALGQKIQKNIKTFSIGFNEGHSPDLEYARKVADYIGSDHTEIKFTFEEAIDSLKQVIWHLETYDCTTIRASVPMFLMSKYVKENTDIKVIMSGEGADELFGGYLYFHSAPSPKDFQKETINLLNNVHMFDSLRADRCTASQGLELRVPFFDKSFINYVLTINPKFKHTTLEKKILRDAFKDMDLLPKEVLYRQKNGMSDAVGYSWVDKIREFAKTIKLKYKATDFINNPPISEEELLYREIYTDMFGDYDATEDIWRPKWTKEMDPSARKLQVFSQ